MVWRAGVRFCVLVVLPHWGCGATDHNPQDAGTGTGGSSAISSTSTAGAAGASGGSGDLGSGAAGASPELPIAHEREREILSPLWTDASALQAASGDELLELARDIALARGYATCRCFFSPDAPPDDLEPLFENCSVVEAFPHVLGELDDYRCVAELRERVPDLDQHLRCAAVNAIEHASGAIVDCTDIGVPPPDLEWSADCSDPTGSFQELQNTCLEAYYCPDGSLNFGSSCDGDPTCPDLSDEFQCFDEVGQDDVLCADGTLRTAWELCGTKCELPLGPNLCHPDGGYGFTCLDGTQILFSTVCNREPDCPGGEDEAICFR